MVTKAEIFPSKYLTAADLKGKPVVLTIAAAPVETLKNQGGEKRKVVLSFKEMSKQLPLNVVNFDSVIDITGEADSDDWPGYRVEVYPTITSMQGKTVDCIRMREPSQGELEVKPKAKAKPKPKPKPEPERDPDLDDEIPFK